MIDAREFAAALLEATTADQVSVPRRCLGDIVARLSELEARAAAVESDPDALLSLAVAADESGYSADYLGRLVKRGAFANHGTKFRPRVRRGDLPLKATSLPDWRRSA